MPFWGTDRNVKDPKLLRNKSWISLVKLVVTIISVISNTKGNHFWSNYFWQLPRPVKLYRYFRRVATFRESLLWELYGVLFLQAGYRRAVPGTIILSNQGNGKGHFGPTDGNDQIGQSRPPSDWVPNIWVGLNWIGLFHLISNRNFRNFGLNGKCPWSHLGIESNLHPLLDLLFVNSFWDIFMAGCWFESTQGLMRERDWWW